MNNQRDPRLGALKDVRKEKDWLYSASRYSKLSVRDLNNLAKYLPPRIDQGSIGSCTAASLVEEALAQAQAKGVFGNIPDRRFSIWWAYNLARALEGTLREDAGAYPRDVLDSIRKYGMLPDKFWPYLDGCMILDKTSPPSKFQPEAAKWPLSSFSDVPQLKGFYRITNGAEGIFQALEAAQQAIEAGSPQHICVYIGTPWPDEWMDTDKYGFLKKPNSSFYVNGGGHMFVIYAGHYKEGWFGMCNTWGAYWGTCPVGTTTGERGCAKIYAESVDWWKSEGGYDAYVVNFEGGNWGVQPEPEPEPVPPIPVPTDTAAYLGLSTDGKTWKVVAQTK